MTTIWVLITQVVKAITHFNSETYKLTVCNDKAILGMISFSHGSKLVKVQSQAGVEIPICS